MPESPITTSLNQFALLKEFLVSLCQRPDSGPEKHLRAVLLRYKPEKRWSRPPQTNTLWRKPLIRTPGLWNYRDLTHMESMRKRQLGQGCSKWFFRRVVTEGLDFFFFFLQQCHSDQLLLRSTSIWGSWGRCSGYWPETRPTRKCLTQQHINTQGMSGMVPVLTKVKDTACLKAN